jgi:hypothetical protein
MIRAQLDSYDNMVKLSILGGHWSVIEPEYRWEPLFHRYIGVVRRDLGLVAGRMDITFSQREQALYIEGQGAKAGLAAFLRLRKV